MEIDYELENLKRFIADGGICWRCGDTGIAEPTFTEPSGSSCDCTLEDSAEYVLEHWEEIKASKIRFLESTDDFDEVDF